MKSIRKRIEDEKEKMGKGRRERELREIGRGGTWRYVDT